MMIDPFQYVDQYKDASYQETERHVVQVGHDLHLSLVRLVHL